MTRKSKLPRKGSKTRAILMLMLRPDGATARELTEHADVAQGTLTGAMQCIDANTGYLIETFPCPPHRTGPRGRGRPPVVYKITGKILPGRRIRRFGEQA